MANQSSGCATQCRPRCRDVLQPAPGGVTALECLLGDALVASDPDQFWTQVWGRPVSPEHLERLVELDVRSWTHPCTATLEAVERARRRGFRTALLSNAPLEIARAVDRLDWLKGFSPRLFSCDLGEVMPALAVYTQALRLLGARPFEVIFVDDRAENVEAARQAGMEAIRFIDPAQLDALGAAPPRTLHQS